MFVYILRQRMSMNDSKTFVFALAVRNKIILPGISYHTHCNSLPSDGSKVDECSVMSLNTKATLLQNFRMMSSAKYLYPVLIQLVKMK